MSDCDCDCDCECECHTYIPPPPRVSQLEDILPLEEKVKALEARMPIYCSCHTCKCMLHLNFAKEVLLWQKPSYGEGYMQRLYFCQKCAPPYDKKDCNSDFWKNNVHCNAHGKVKRSFFNWKEGKQ